MIDEKYSDDHSFCGEAGMDDSAKTVKMSNRQPWPRCRRQSHQDTPTRGRLMTEASRWESFPSSRRLAPPRRPITPPPSSSSSYSTHTHATLPPLLTTLRPQESQGCNAPRVPQRKSSFEVIKRPDDPKQQQKQQQRQQALMAPPQPILRRHISDDSASLSLGNKVNYSDTNTAALRAPTRQPSFE